MMFNIFISLLGLCICVAAWLMLFTSSRVYTVLYMIFIYMCMSILFMYIGAIIIGVFFFLVYIGAIAVLFLFSVMILELKEVAIERDYSIFTSFFIILTIIFIQIYIYCTLGDHNIYLGSYEYTLPTNDVLKVLGLLLFNDNMYVIIFSGVALLVAMIGAIFLTNEKKGFLIKKQIAPTTRNMHIYIANIY